MSNINKRKGNQNTSNNGATTPSLGILDAARLSESNRINIERENKVFVMITDTIT